MGIAGIGILVVLVSISIGTAIIFPVETFQQWNNPQSWLSYPKTAMPLWVNLFMFEKIPEHKILAEPNVRTQTVGEISVVSVSYTHLTLPTKRIV